MMHRLAAITLGTLLLAGLVLASAGEPQKQTALYCTLAKKRIEKCCCEPRGEKLYCPLAKKTIDTCCCQPAEAQRSKKSKNAP